jgi:hypothetical protein
VDGFDDFGVVDALQIDRGDAEVLCPSWRWMTIRGTPSRAISTACVFRSGCGAKRRPTPARAAARRSSARAPLVVHGRPRARPMMMQNSGPTGSVIRAVSHGSSSCHPQSSIPTSRRRPPLPRRTSSEPRRRSRSASCSASASSIRRPARHNTATSPRRRRPCRLSPTICMTATISVTVGGSAGYRRPLLRGGRPARKPGIVAGERRRPAASITGDAVTGLYPGYDRNRRLSPRPSRRAQVAPSEGRSGHGAKAPGGTARCRRRCSVAWKAEARALRSRP